MGQAEQINLADAEPEFDTRHSRSAVEARARVEGFLLALWVMEGKERRRWASVEEARRRERRSGSG